MAKYGIPAIALCIGPDGMAKTPEQKVATAELLYKSGKAKLDFPLNFIGFEIDQNYFEISKDRIDKENRTKNIVITDKKLLQIEGIHKEISDLQSNL